MIERGWTDSPFELLKVQLLVHVSLATADGRVPAVQSYADALRADASVLVDAAKALAGDGLLTTESSLGGGLWAHTTSRAAAALQERAARLGNPKQRAVACREALLDWCYVKDAEGHTPGLDDFERDVRGHFEGDPFSASELDRASTDLRDKGLIGGSGTMGGGIPRPQITAQGKTVVESYDGVIQRYESRETYQGQPVVNFHGTMSGQVAIGNANHLNQAGTSSSDLQSLIASVLEAALGTPTEEQVGRLVTAVQLEVDQEEPDGGVIGKHIERLQAVSTKAGSAALTAAIGKLVDSLSQGLGLT